MPKLDVNAPSAILRGNDRKTICITMRNTTIETVRAIAAKEYRSVSSMIEVLLAAAIKARVERA